MRTFATGLAALLLTATATADFSPPPAYTAVYELAKGPLTLGRATLRFERPGDDRYAYSLSTKAAGVARLFYNGEMRESSRGRITDDGFRPMYYVMDRTGDDHAKHVEVTFDWDAGRAINHARDDAWRLKVPPGTLDRVVSPLQLMHDLTERADDRPLTYRIADDGELKVYTVRIAGHEKVDTPEGEYDTIKVVRRGRDGDRETRLWCAPALQYLPVQIEQWEKDDGSMTLQLARLEGLVRNEDTTAGARR